MVSIIVGVFFLLMFSGMLIFPSMGIASWIYLHLNNLMSMLPQKGFSAINSYSLIAVPFFMFTGLIMSAGKITDTLVKFADSLVGHVHGGLGHVNIMVSMLMAGVSGSAMADVSGVGSTLIPSMIKDGYSRSYSAVVTAVSSTVGPVIPPSIHMVIYACIAQVSIAKLFLAGIVPGIAMGTYMMILNYFICKKRAMGGKGIKRFDIKAVPVVTFHALPCLTIPIVIVGGIVSGIFTAIEASIIAAFIALLIEVFIYKSLGFKKIIEVLQSTVIKSSVVFILVAMASVFAWILSIMQIQELLANIFLSISRNPLVILLFVNIFMLILGMFISPMVIIMFVVPTFLPFLMKLGIDPIHFGIITVLNVMIGFVTPPVGFTMLVSCSIAKTKIKDFVKEVIPWYFPLLFNLVFVILFPDIVLYLPNLLS